MLRTLTVLLALCAFTLPGVAQSHIPSKVNINWDRMYDYDELADLMHQLAAAYPDLLTLQSIGKSIQGRDMWMMTLNNPATGPDTEKPAMWIDANIHGNEVQGGEVVLYSIWYLTKSYGKVDSLTELIDRTAFYFLPTVNPDSRAHWFREPNTPHSQRSGQKPLDNDFDGMKDEDGPEDLDGDGSIGSMWRFDPNGRYRRNRIDPRIIERVTDPREKGELSRVGSEGIDNDGDGRINEDGPGGYDMNRNWPAGWQPSYIQYGSGDYPFSFPETRCIGKFILAHPNIAACQSYHNSGGMILRGPGAKYRQNLYPRADKAVYDALAKAGEEILPFYKYMIIWSDLYQVHGGTVNWTAETLGITSFTNELWNSQQILQKPDGNLDREAMFRWYDRLLFGQVFTDWTEYDHPTLGKVLIGGTTKYSSRVPPMFMLEELCHRNFAFTMFHAGEMPVLSFPWIEIKQLSDAGDDSLWQITLEIANEKIIPTRTAVAAQKKMGQPDRLTLTGDGVTVVTSGSLNDRFDKTIDPRPRKSRLNIIPIERGISSRGRRTYRYLVTGAEGRDVSLSYSAEKARDLSVHFSLQPQIIEANSDDANP